MRSFSIREFRMLSRVEKAAMSVSFQNPVTVITGENDTGKSSLMKTIYWTLGCEPARVSDAWRDLDICAALTVDLDGRILTFVRHNRQVALFDAAGELLKAFEGITRELAPFLANLFGFGLILNNRKTGEAETPPPAFYLLPYCMDQDTSWSATWSSFNGLQQYADWKKDASEYHIGLRDGAYYAAKAKRRSLAADRAEPERELRALTRALDQVRARLASVAVVEIDLEIFQREIDILLGQIQTLSDEQEIYRRRMEELIGKRMFLQSQAQLARAVLTEVEKDYGFALQQSEEVGCPTCGATYHNSIIERFSLAVDQVRCEDVLVDVSGELSVINREIDEAKTSLERSRTTINAIEEMLTTKRGLVTLKEVIQSQARGEAVDVLEGQRREIQSVLLNLSEADLEAADTLAKLESRERRRDFKERFEALLDRFSIAVNVPAPTPVSSFSPNIAETGSDVPRAILAYQFAVLGMAWAREGAVHAPLCIDSPNQQDQDPSNYKSMLKLIRDNRPDDQQLILALVDTAGIDFPGGALKLTEKRRILQKSLFDTVGSELNKLVARMYAALET